MGRGETILFPREREENTQPYFFWQVVAVARVVDRLLCTLGLLVGQAQD